MAATGGILQSQSLIDEFVVQADVRASTRTKYRQHLGAFARWLSNTADADPRSVVAATPADVQRFMAHLRTCTGHADVPLSPSTSQPTQCGRQGMCGGCWGATSSVPPRNTRSGPGSGTCETPRHMPTPHPSGLLACASVLSGK